MNENNIIDFTEYEIDKMAAYGGANGSKVGIIYNNETYMLKFPPKIKYKGEVRYSNSPISEYIACKIIKSIGLDVQEVILGHYDNKIVVACKDFLSLPERFYDFTAIKNTIIDSRTNGHNTELKEILYTIEKQEVIGVDELKKYFWEMFIVDALLGNPNRNNRSWGFKVNTKTKEYEMAPIYGCGSCLYPSLTELQMPDILESKEEIDKRIYTLPNSIIKINNKKINYYDYLTTTDNEDCLKALQDITKRINLEDINCIIDNTRYIFDSYKLFLKTVIKERKERILDKAIEINPNIIDYESFMWS